MPANTNQSDALLAALSPSDQENAAAVINIASRGGGEHLGNRPRRDRLTSGDPALNQGLTCQGVNRSANRHAGLSRDDLHSP